jgi:hypothetical protein
MGGGTLLSMVPEQIEAFFNPDLWGRVGTQTDIYSFGPVLREHLTGAASNHSDRRLSPARSIQNLLDRWTMFDPSMRLLDPSILHAWNAIVV